VLIVSPDQRQAAICLNYVNACFDDSPMLRQLVLNRTQKELNLKNKVSIVVRSSDFKRIRGSTFLAVVIDEVAFLRSEESGSANPDIELINSVKPGLATTDGKLFMISSPYAHRGELWRYYKNYYGPDCDPMVLVAHATSRQMNPTLSQAVVDRALERDYAAASAEYMAVFRTDIESFVSREAVDAATVPDRYELAPMEGMHYQAFCDPSGGQHDDFTLAIVHNEDNRVIVDCLRKRHPPFSPDAVITEFAETLRSYGITSIRGDHYAGIYPRERFAVHGITYRLSDKNKSDLYAAFLPILNSGQVHLLDNKTLINQRAHWSVARRAGARTPSTTRLGRRTTWRTLSQAQSFTQRCA
jgi:hypothetical protein